MHGGSFEHERRVKLSQVCEVPEVSHSSHVSFASRGLQSLDNSMCFYKAERVEGYTG